MKKILIVDDEETLCEALRFNLESEGYDVDVAYSAEDALGLNLSQYSLVLLDIMMGDISGTQLARIMKHNPATASVPVIFCTARDSVDDMVDGLDLGADDYITKPYSIKNVLARIRSVLRRSESNESNTTQGEAVDSFTYKGLTVIPSRKLCLIDGNEIKMPRKEFEILSTLIHNPSKVFSREELLAAIWPEEVVVLDRVVDVNITRLRSKLGTYARNIVTRSGYGYCFME